ncbi:MAG: delta-60 repeat domain-containing protein, partial [Leptospiraceae bacterium]|nr:delta-60 repeat domain-containing protein [Leptospiraceae bacterium]
DGTVDTAFGTSGKMNIAIPATSVKILSDNKILIGGGSNHFSLARYNSNFTLDTSFGNSGTTTTDFGNASSMTNVLVLSDGKIIGTGNYGTTSPKFALARYSANGILE